jgi:hypothetical protein
MADPCSGNTRGTTFDSQGTCVLPFKGKYIVMVDCWNRLDLESSTYVWLPLEIENDKIHIK